MSHKVHPLSNLPSSDSIVGPKQTTTNETKTQQTKSILDYLLQLDKVVELLAQHDLCVSSTGGDDQSVRWRPILQAVDQYNEARMAIVRAIVGGSCDDPSASLGGVQDSNIQTVGECQLLSVRSKQGSTSSIEQLDVQRLVTSDSDTGELDGDSYGVVQLQESDRQCNGTRCFADVHEQLEDWRASDEKDSVTSVSESQFLDDESMDTVSAHTRVFQEQCVEYDQRVLVPDMTQTVVEYKPSISSGMCSGLSDSEQAHGKVLRESRKQFRARKKRERAQAFSGLIDETEYGIGYSIYWQGQVVPVMYRSNDVSHFSRQMYGMLLDHNVMLDVPFKYMTLAAARELNTFKPAKDGYYHARLHTDMYRYQCFDKESHDIRESGVELLYKMIYCYNTYCDTDERLVMVKNAIPIKAYKALPFVYGVAGLDNSAEKYEKWCSGRARHSNVVYASVSRFVIG